jgi:hypothetical protein
MTARVTYFDRAPAYVAPRHTGVHAVRPLLVTISAE